MLDELTQESLMVPVSGKVQLHLRRIRGAGTGDAQPVLMVHGAAEDGHIFYSHVGRGLACYLARNGFDVFVADLRGKGKSWPAINQHSDFGFHELITEDLPALSATVARACGGREQTWVTHSLGGPLAAAAVARAGAEVLGVRQMVHFAARRQQSVGGWRRRFFVDGMWNRLGAIGVAFEGYLPANRLGLGTSRESARCFRDGLAWSNSDHWLDQIGRAHV